MHKCRKQRFTDRHNLKERVQGRIFNNARAKRMTSPVLFTWLSRIFVVVLLVQGLSGPTEQDRLLGLPQVWAQARTMMDDREHQNHGVHHQATTPQTGQWEGSPEGIAYSEFNHGLAGIGVILVGLSELRTAMGWHALAWARWLLPASLFGSGIFLLIWSDHLAWPIGSWTLAETLSGKDPEMLQHKIFGILALAVGTVEWFLRAGKFSHLFWRALLPGFALVGGMMLFIHMHGPHPAGHHIQLHHNIMGTLALAGSLAWFSGEFMTRSYAPLHTSSHLRSVLKILWALLVITIGVQLFFYSES
jgi:putative copper resistance protein D